MLKKLALGTIVPLFATIGLSGCQSLHEQASATEAAKVEASNTPTPQSQWPKLVTIPSGTTLLVSLDRPLSTDLNESGDDFQAHTSEAVRVDQVTILPRGTEIHGRLTLVEKPQRTTGRAQMTLVFEEIVDPSGQSHSISTAPIVLVAGGDKISNAENAAGGAVLGSATAGGIVALAAKGKQMELLAGQHFSVHINEPFRVSGTQLTATR